MFVAGEEAGKKLSVCINLQRIICHAASEVDHQVSQLFVVSRVI